MSKKNIEKIYSRKRFLLSLPTSNKGNSSFKNREADKKIRKNIIKIIIIMLVIILTLQIIFSYVEPIFQAMCEEKVKSLATIITNQQ